MLVDKVKHLIIQKSKYLTHPTYTYKANMVFLYENERSVFQKKSIYGKPINNCCGGPGNVIAQNDRQNKKLAGE